MPHGPLNPWFEKELRTYAHLTTRRTSLGARANALAPRRHRLDAEIHYEMKRPVPCQLQLTQLDQFKRQLKDEITEIEGVLTTVPRLWLNTEHVERKQDRRRPRNVGLAIDAPLTQANAINSSSAS